MVNNNGTHNTLEVQDISHPEIVYRVQVSWFQKIKDLKVALHRLSGIVPTKQYIFDISCPTPLSNNVSLGIFGEGHKLRMGVNDRSSSEFVITRVNDLCEGEECMLIRLVRKGLERHYNPSKTDILDCTGGVYFMRDGCGRKVAVFKPFDEEQGMVNNNKGYQGTGEHGLRPYFKPGLGYVREFAAFVMDKDGFSNVPHTSIVHLEHPSFNYPGGYGAITKGVLFPKVGSLQEFVNSTCTFEDLGSSMLSDFEVQKIALFDLRLLNCDRNSSNILVNRRQRSPWEGSKSRRSQSDLSEREDCCCSNEEEMMFDFTDAHEDQQQCYYELIPIDHGYCFPSRLQIAEVDLAWFWYPQLHRPVHEEIKKYLQQLDLTKLLEELTRHVQLAPDSIFLLKVVHQLLVEGVSMGLTLGDIAELVVRVDDDVPSALERLISVAEDNAFRTIEFRFNGHTTVGNVAKSPKDKPFAGKANLLAAVPEFGSFAQPQSPAIIRPQSRETNFESLSPLPNLRGVSSSTVDIDAVGLPLDEEPVDLSVHTNLDFSSSFQDFESFQRNRMGGLTLQRLVTEPEPRNDALFSVSKKDPFEVYAGHNIQDSQLSVQLAQLNVGMLPKSIAEDDDDTDVEHYGDVVSSLSSTGSTSSAATVLTGTMQTDRMPLPPMLERVTSFAGFGSKSEYQMDPKERKLGKLQHERRLQMAQSPEFERLRLHFCSIAVTTLVSNKIKSKQVS